VLITGWLASAARANDARIIEERQVTGRVIELTIATPAFVAPTKVHVDLPVGYDADPSRRWPVTYFTAGTMNRYSTFNDFLGGEKLASAYPSIIVSPDANSAYWSDWYNGGAFGPPKYETFVIDQLIPLIDARFRTLADRAHRAVFGISMGGYGSMMFAARHPDLFVAAASLSGAVDSNLPANGAVLSMSSTFDGAAPDAIYGPRATQEVRWRGHNPADLAANLRDLDLQVRTANGIPNPSIGEGEGSGDVPSCIVEKGVQMASVDLHQQLDALGIAHAWKDYGPGCHTVPNFQREVLDTLAVFQRVLANPPVPPVAFDYRSIEPHFDVWGWHVDADPARALEFLRLQAGRDGVTLEGSDRTTVTTPAWYQGLETIDVNGTPTAVGDDGRLRFTVDLGAADTDQQYTPGAKTTVQRRRVPLAPHAVVRIAKVTLVKRGVRVCARVIGGEVPRARITAGGRSVVARIGAKTSCHVLRVRHSPATVTVRGRDRFGHPVSARAATYRGSGRQDRRRGARRASLQVGRAGRAG
jgi:S-formylglutathione hydrolase FrmB